MSALDQDCRWMKRFQKATFVSASFLIASSIPQSITGKKLKAIVDEHLQSATEPGPFGCGKRSPKALFLPQNTARCLVRTAVHDMGAGNAADAQEVATMLSLESSIEALSELQERRHSELLDRVGQLLGVSSGPALRLKQEGEPEPSPSASSKGVCGGVLAEEPSGAGPLVDDPRRGASVGLLDVRLESDGIRDAGVVSDARGSETEATKNVVEEAAESIGSPGACTIFTSRLEETKPPALASEAAREGQLSVSGAEPEHKRAYRQTNSSGNEGECSSPWCGERGRARPQVIRADSAEDRLDAGRGSSSSSKPVYVTVAASQIEQLLARQAKLETAVADLHAQILLRNPPQ